MLRQRPIRLALTMAFGVCAIAVGGCAGLPRIDPTGERCFIWPQTQVAPVANNVTAPPVFTDPVFPQPSLSAPAIAQGVGLAVPPVPHDRLRVTPDRVLAPIGSEVILKAGVCMPNQYFLTGTKIEWLLARESAGEFVSLGGRGYIRQPLLPWNRPKKVDNQYAVGYSANVPLRITRGTADPSDDVQVEPGEAWASLTSPVEGVSHLTAVAPEIEAWQGRRATAAVYWVDVQWTFPPATVSGNGSHVLSTTVRRQSDGAPLEGWLVRYEVADGGALTEQESDQTVDVTTDSNGRASIDVTPTGGAGTTSRINAQLVRPARLGGPEWPRLAIANSTTTIHWTDSGTPYLPPADDLGSAPPSLPPANTPISPTPAPSPAGAPALELEIRSNDTRVPVGGEARFQIVVRNRGNATATGISLVDEFDTGFSHLKDRLGTRRIEQQLMQTLAPGASLTDFITFGVTRSGALCHNVTVACAEGSEASKRACIEAFSPPTEPRASMSVTKSAPERRTVGETARFTVAIQNTGEVPLTAVEVIDEYDPALAPTPTQQGYRIVNDRIVWAIPRIEAGQTVRLDVECRCLAPSRQACSTVQVSAKTGTSSGTISQADRRCVEIAPSPNVVPQPGVMPPSRPVGPNVVPNSQQGSLKLDLRALSTATLRVGQIARYEVVVSRNATTRDQQVQLSVVFPPGLLPDVNNAPNIANLRPTLVGNTLRFPPIAEIRQIERLTFNVQATVNQLSGGQITAQVTSREQTEPLQKSIPVEVIR